MKEEGANKRGGARPGAGRKPRTDGRRMYTFWLDPAVAAKIPRPKGDFVNAAIIAALDKGDA